MLQKLDFASLTQQFEQWAKEHLESEPGEGIAIDGKSITSTVDKDKADYQNFVSMVSVYSQKQGIILATQAIDHKSSSELKVVQKLLEALALQDVVVTLDAYTAKKTTQLVALAWQRLCDCRPWAINPSYFTSYKPFVKKINLLNDLLMLKKPTTVSPATSLMYLMTFVKLTVNGQLLRVLFK